MAALRRSETAIRHAAPCTQRELGKQLQSGVARVIDDRAQPRCRGTRARRRGAIHRAWCTALTRLDLGSPQHAGARECVDSSIYERPSHRDGHSKRRVSFDRRSDTKPVRGCLDHEGEDHLLEQR